MNAAPPYSPVMYGKRQTLPSPTAEPAVASITPSFVPKLALSKCVMVVFLVCALSAMCLRRVWCSRMAFKSVKVAFTFISQSVANV